MSICNPEPEKFDVTYVGHAESEMQDTTTHHDESLKPCPFCGGASKISGDGEAGYCVICRSADCYAAVGERYDRDGIPNHHYGYEKSAIAAWNRRAEQPQPAPMQVDSLMVWPELPKPWHVQYDEIDGRDIPCYSPEQVRAYTERAIVAALASRAEHAVPPGYKLVPIEPTP